MDYNVDITKEHCKVSDAISYVVDYSPNFPEASGEKISSFKTSKFESLVEKVSQQVGISETREDDLIIHLDENQFSDPERHSFFEALLS